MAGVTPQESVVPRACDASKGFTTVPLFKNSDEDLVRPDASFSSISGIVSAKNPAASSPMSPCLEAKSLDSVFCTSGIGAKADTGNETDDFLCTEMSTNSISEDGSNDEPSLEIEEGTAPQTSEAKLSLE
jgi:hypothetical protein